MFKPKLANPEYAKTKINISDSSVTLFDVTRSTGREAKFDHINGKKSKDPVYNVKGCKLSADLILVQTYPTDPFALMLRVGDDWLQLASLRSDDSFIKELAATNKLTICGPSPNDIAQRKRKEAEKQRLEDEAKERLLAREQVAKERILQGAKHQGRAA